jgi:hypothetical protein
MNSLIQNLCVFAPLRQETKYPGLQLKAKESGMTVMAGLFIPGRSYSTILICERFPLFYSARTRLKI